MHFTRLELAFSHPMEEYPIFKDLEKDANHLYSFFSRSSKRYDLLNKYVKNQNKPTFKLTRLYDVR